MAKYWPTAHFSDGTEEEAQEPYEAESFEDAKQKAEDDLDMLAALFEGTESECQSVVALRNEETGEIQTYEPTACAA